MLSAVVFVAAGWAAWFSYELTAGLPDRNALKALGDMAQATTILDAADKPAFTIFKEQRIEIPIEKMSPNLIKAVISVEDQRFYEHSGVDAVRVAAAVVRNFEEGRRAEGGSTITQQLARQSFLTRDKTYRRKLKEVILAAYIEKMYGKNEILELYLNKVYFGGGLYGVEAASRGYFGKAASELDVPEAALLAGLIQSPSSYAPSVNLDRAIARRNVVLQAMVSTGAIDQATADRARRSPVHLVNGLEIQEVVGTVFQGAGPARARRHVSAGSGSTRAACESTRRSIRHCSNPLKRWSRRGSSDIEKSPGLQTSTSRPDGAGQGRRTSAVSAGRAGRHGSDQRIRARHGRGARLRRESIQPRGSSQAAGRFRVQAVRVCRRARGGIFAGDVDHRLERSDCHAARRLGSRG